MLLTDQVMKNLFGISFHNIFVTIQIHYNGIRRPLKSSNYGNDARSTKKKDKLNNLYSFIAFTTLVHFSRGNESIVFEI